MPLVRPNAANNRCGRTNDGFRRYRSGHPRPAGAFLFSALFLRHRSSARVLCRMVKLIRGRCLIAFARSREPCRGCCRQEVIDLRVVPRLLLDLIEVADVGNQRVVGPAAHSIVQGGQKRDRDAGISLAFHPVVLASPGRAPRLLQLAPRKHRHSRSRPRRQFAA